MTPRVRHSSSATRSGQGLAAVVVTAVVTALLLASPAHLRGQESLRRPQFSPSLAGGALPVSTDGTLDLSWQLDDAGPRRGDAGGAIAFELEETRAGGESVRIDAGPHLAAALSGRDDGRYRYRVRAVSRDGPASPWSEPIEVRVEHHSLWLASLLFGIGAAVFLATAGLVLVGHRRTSPARS